VSYLRFAKGEPVLEGSLRNKAIVKESQSSYAYFGPRRPSRI
jgi:hypothetical protein